MSETKKPWYKDGLPLPVHRLRRLLHGGAGLCVGQQRRRSPISLPQVGLEVEDFESEYVRQIGVRKSLVEFENGDCVFFDGKTRKCRVYTARPRQCRTWPFWESNVRTPEAWAETCQVCPGSGTGRLYQLGEIETQKAVIRV